MQMKILVYIYVSVELENDDKIHFNSLKRIQIIIH